jgi:hypothetical protein
LIKEEASTTGLKKRIARLGSQLALWIKKDAGGESGQEDGGQVAFRFQLKAVFGK